MKESGELHVKIHVVNRGILYGGFPNNMVSAPTELLGSMALKILIS
jgi:hypothetical protein